MALTDRHLLLSILTYYLKFLDLWFKSYAISKFILIFCQLFEFPENYRNDLYPGRASHRDRRVGPQPRWQATSASGPPAGLTDGGGQDRRVVAVIGGTAAHRGGAAVP